MCGSVRYWLKHYGSKHGPHAQAILLCDGGGSNGSQQYLFKQVLQQLSNQIDVETRIAHVRIRIILDGPIKSGAKSLRSLKKRWKLSWVNTFHSETVQQCPNLTSPGLI